MYIYTSNSASHKVPRQEFIYRTSPTLVINSQTETGSILPVCKRYFHTLVVVDFQTRTNFPRCPASAIFTRKRNFPTIKFEKSNVHCDRFPESESLPANGNHNKALFGAHMYHSI